MTWRSAFVLFVILGIALPTISAQKQELYRLAWRDDKTAVVQHDKNWTSDLGTLFVRELKINFSQAGSRRSWIQRKRTILGIIPWFPKDAKFRDGSTQASGRFRRTSLHHIYSIIF
jgi:hypothetical protein